MGKQKLIVIDTKTNHYKAYEGKALIDEATFSRPMFSDEIEAFRTDPRTVFGDDDENESA